MKVTRIYTGEDRRSHFEDLDIPLTPARQGSMSELVPTVGVIFRETPVDTLLDFHPAERRQIVITMTGMTELECGDGSRRRFGPGDILLAEDTTGQGHITREIKGPRKSVILPLADSFKTSAWRGK